MYLSTQCLRLTWFPFSMHFTWYDFARNRIEFNIKLNTYTLLGTKSQIIVNSHFLNSRYTRSHCNVHLWFLLHPIWITIESTKTIIDRYLAQLSHDFTEYLHYYSFFLEKRMMFKIHIYIAWSAAILTFREVVRKLDNLTFCKIFT